MSINKEAKQTKNFDSLFSDDAQRWQAVQDRDGSADGRFVYAVKTTKIYCRPICKARLARRANVSFYETGLEAQNAGFRACKRCKPELEGAMPEERAVRQIRAFVEQQRQQRSAASQVKRSTSMDTRLSLSQMARQTGLSKWHFHRVFKRCVGLTPSDFLRAEKEAAAIASSSGSPPTSGTLSPWTDSDLDIALGWPTPRDEGYNIDFALFDVESALVPLNDIGLAWDDASMSFDDFLAWPEEMCKPV
ncbi:hypothetical protein NLG97_g7993 [Lecanicillium saksenae]|uniref:Uncharacterized protein n=1 Tax=Lecanicillium saksenae TaxID=468837 RepID=A0ACC1QK87_9HYPO|nr:hypothetical protein NLG97_g7993 [Lecanicillium saksenae]